MPRGGGVSAPDPLDQLYDKADKDALKSVREERLIMVGQGDLVKHRIDKIMLVDYVTETMIAEIKGQIKPNEISWKFDSSTGAALSKAE